ncbi:MAG: hypothetical protein MZV64_13645 [Ignavibacteriales bacterium]|nr:hypothetical protein [Ignavibacteriales bacterium]
MSIARPGTRGERRQGRALLPAAGRRPARRPRGTAAGWRGRMSQDVPAQVLVLDDVGEHAVDVGCVNRNRSAREVGPFERDLVEQLLHDRLQPARADVLHPLVDQRRQFRHPLDGVVGELEVDALGGEQRRVLRDQRVAAARAGCGRTRRARARRAPRGSGTGPAARG